MILNNQQSHLWP